MERAFQRTCLAVAAAFASALAMAAPLPEYAPGRLIVRYRGALRPEALARSVVPLGVVVQREDHVLGFASVAVPDPDRVAAVAQALSRDPAVWWVEPDAVVRAEQMPDDPSLGEQYSVRQVQADLAWRANRGDPSVVIAIVDSGIDLDHPDIAPKLVPGANLIDGRAGPDDDFGHGTQVAGIAAASTNNGLGIAGIGYACSLMPVKVLKGDGSGLTSNVAAGIVWAVQHGAQVVSLSLGSTSASRTLADAIDYAYSRGVLVVAAAGNGGASAPFYPAAYPRVLSVGATDRSGRRASFSNYGDWVDVAAPGMGLLTTVAGGGYGPLSGTSAACPMVAGLAGLVCAALGGNADPASVQARIMEGCDGVGDWLAAGQVNAAASVDPSLLWEPELSLRAAIMTGGRSTTAVLSLTKPAPSGGATFRIEPSGEAVKTPASVRIPAGYRMRSFLVRTSPVAAPEVVRILAAGGSAQASATVRVEPATLREVALAPRRVRSGRRVLLTVRLTGPAPASGLAVRLTSSDPDVLSLPDVATVRPGRSFASVACMAGRAEDGCEVAVTAQAGEVERSTRVRIVP